jgi:hypothetical protein
MTDVRVVRVASSPRTVVVTIRDPDPAHPIPGERGRYLDSLLDVEGVAGAAPGVAYILRKGADGILRPEPAATAPPPLWGDQIRFRRGIPTDPEAPLNAVQFDTDTGRGYRHIDPEGA